MSQWDAFHDLLVTALPQLRGYAHVLTQNRGAAEDLVHDAVVSALAARESFVPGTNFRTWLHRILYNHFIKDTRKQQATAGLDHLPEALLGVGPTQDHRLVLGQLRSAVAHLPRQQRAALLMVALQGMTYKEVAEATGCPVGTAKIRVFRARNQLRAWLLADTPPYGSDPWCRTAVTHGQDTTFSGTISGPGSVVKSGSAATSPRSWRSKSAVGRSEAGSFHLLTPITIRNGWRSPSSSPR